jgi:tRNA nucleotidyltransferase/poly(A) polymerase
MSDNTWRVTDIKLIQKLQMLALLYQYLNHTVRVQASAALKIRNSTPSDKNCKYVSLLYVFLFANLPMFGDLENAEKLSIPKVGLNLGSTSTQLKVRCDYSSHLV